MARKKKTTAPAPEEQETPVTAGETTPAPEAQEVPPQEPTPETPAEAPAEAPAPAEDWEAKYTAERDSHLRLAAEFDNFRKRPIKEKAASYGNGKADAVAKMLPVYDNLERALNQETTDAAFKKGVEMTMAELVKIFT